MSNQPQAKPPQVTIISWEPLVRQHEDKTKRPEYEFSNGRKFYRPN